jgi:hypothetical protein
MFYVLKNGVGKQYYIKLFFVCFICLEMLITSFLAHLNPFTLYNELYVFLIRHWNPYIVDKVKLMVISKLLIMAIEDNCSVVEIILILSSYDFKPTIISIKALNLISLWRCRYDTGSNRVHVPSSGKGLTNKLFCMA